MLYGTSFTGGIYAGEGTVFAVGTNGTASRGLAYFPAMSLWTNSTGANPYGGLALSGNSLYGTTYNGGSTSYGTLFKVNADNAGLTVLHVFPAGTPYIGGQHCSCVTNTDGVGPAGGLIVSGDTLYGTAVYGGDWGGGTVFAVNTNGACFTTLHSFAAGNYKATGLYTNSDGANPYAGLVLSRNTLYGTTSQGSSSGYGTVFSLTLPPPPLTIDHSGTNVVITWPTYAPGVWLQSTTNLVLPAVWRTNLPSPVVVNGWNTVTKPASGTRTFYRLSQ
jgi:uncharacterized repeat protein (TIGR03803 family)